MILLDAIQSEMIDAICVSSASIILLYHYYSSKNWKAEKGFLQKDLDDLKEKIKSEQSLSVVQEEIIQKEEEISSKESDIKDENDLDSGRKAFYNQLIEDYEEQVGEYRIQIEDLKKRKDDLVKSLDDLTRSIKSQKDSESKINEYKKDLSSIIFQIDEKKKELNNKRIELSSITDKIASAQKEYNEKESKFLDRVIDYEQQIDALKNQKEELNKSINDIKHEITSKEDADQILNGIIKSISEKKKELESINKEISDNYIRNKSDMDKYLQLRSNEESKIKDLLSEEEKLKSSIHEMESILQKKESYENEILDLGIDIEKQKEVLEDLRSSNSSLRKDIIAKANEEKLQIIRQANYEADRIRREVESLSEKRKEADRILEFAKSEYDRHMRESDDYFTKKMRQAREYESMIEERAKDRNKEILKGAKEKDIYANSMIAKMRDARRKLFSSITEAEFLMEMEEKKISINDIEEYIQSNSDGDFKKKISEIESILQDKRKKNEAVKICSTTREYALPWYKHDMLNNLTIGYFDLLSCDVINNGYKIGLEKSYKRLMEIKNRLDIILIPFGSRIDDSYFDEKSKLLHARYSYEEYKQRRKAAIAQERERIREEEKAQREYDREMRQAKKDEEKARRLLEETRKKLEEEKENEKRFQELSEKISGLESALQEAISRGERAKSMAEQTRRGYVYVISNIGSFGKDVYKIGLTRRIDPLERVRELGDASVPFPFDVHAIIESEDAPALESELHRIFEDRKVNKMNGRKEFFNVSLYEIEQAVKGIGIDATFIEDIPAQQYRDSLLVGKEDERLVV